MVLQALGLVALGAVIPTAAMLAAKLRPRLLGGALRSVAAKASSAAPTWTPTPPPQKVGGSRQWELLQNTRLACPDPRCMRVQQVKVALCQILSGTDKAENIKTAVEAVRVS